MLSTTGQITPSFQRVRIKQCFLNVSNLSRGEEKWETDTAVLHDGAFVGSGMYVFVEMYVSELACTCLGICVYIASVTNKDVWDDEKEKSLNQ